jgi:hypothetical protein
LLEIINKSEYGPKRWKLIAKALNSATGGNKTPSQCCTFLLSKVLDSKLIQ